MYHHRDRVLYLVVNGIFTSQKVVDQMRRHVDVMCGPNARFVHVYEWPPYSVPQFVNAFFMCRFLNVHIQAVQRLHNQVLGLLRGCERLVIVCHSFGAVITKRCVDFLMEEQKKRIVIHAFGPAEMIPRDVGVAEAVNFYNKHDCVQLLCAHQDKSLYNVVVDRDPSRSVFYFYDNHVAYTRLILKHKSLPFVRQLHELPANFNVFPSCLLV